MLQEVVWMEEEEGAGEMMMRVRVKGRASAKYQVASRLLLMPTNTHPQ
jgi:hypothetical protein